MLSLYSKVFVSLVVSHFSVEGSSDFRSDFPVPGHYLRFVYNQTKECSILLIIITLSKV